MDQIKKYFLEVSLRRAVRRIFLTAFLCICLLSAATIFWMLRVQGDISAKKEYTADPVYGMQMEPLSRQEAVIYYGCDAAMVLLPVCYLFFGLAVSAGILYRMKMKQPIEELEHAAAMTAAGDLDFSISYSSGDELGKLCRSMELMRRQLCEGREKTWELLRQRKLVHASVAHDLRTPITVLKGYMDFLRTDGGDKKLSDPEVSAALGGIHEALQRLEQYVECVRDIDKLEDLKVNRRSEDTNRMMQEIERAVGSFGGKKVEICCSLEQDQIYVDKQLLIRLIENLTQNAVRYAQNKVTIAVRRENGYLVICVEDDGKGFGPEELRQAAELFYTTQKETHFGIGLSICSVICEKMDGRLSLKNREGGGACVSAYIKG